MSAFSRLQLAAALLEYDNDISNPNAPYRSAHESAIFAHLRQHAPPRPRRSTDYLGVPLPSEVGTVGGRESTATFGHKKSGSSIHALSNPFGGTEDEDDPEKEGLEVDLASWGLDAFIPKDKATRNATKLQERSDTLPNPHPVTSLRQGSGPVVEPARRRLPGSRSMSMGNFDDFGAGGVFLDAQSSINPRPRSVGDLFDHDARQSQELFHRHRASSHVLIETLPSAPPLHSVPFPTSGSRSGSPQPFDNGNIISRPASRASGQLLDDDRPARIRTYSSNTLGSRRLLDEEEQNTFAVRPPSPDRASRFDPKANRARTMSHASLGTRNFINDDGNVFAVRPPSRSSKFDPKVSAHIRAPSDASMGSRMLLDNDSVSMMGGPSIMSGRPLEPRDRPYSTIDLLRPKVLVMPSPLQATLEPKEPEPVRDGFQFSTDGPPLPPGARSARSTSATYDPPVASHLFTPNPRLSLSLSQLAFRNTLMIGGERDVAYADIDYKLPRATEEGEQMQFVMEQPELEAAEVPERVALEEPPKVGRPAGKLFGKSLIDDLEQRKAMMRNKQRVFQGDDRPSMMVRGQLQRSSTLIDPDSLQRPIPQHQDSYRSPLLERRNSSNAQPLLNFDDSKLGNKATLSPNPRTQNGRSVFGIDTLWEREMKKLKEIEAQEKLEKEAMEKREAEEAARQEQKKNGKASRVKAKISSANEEKTKDAESTSTPPVSISPPILPALPKSTGRGPPPPVNDDDTESDSDDSIRESLVQRQGRGSTETAADRWVAGSSDEEDNGPRRTTGVGLRYPAQRRGRPQPADDDSEEDLPLAATVERALQRVKSSSGDDSDEDQPLSVMLDKAKAVLPINFDNLAVENPNDEEDDQPLGLRMSSIAPSSHALGSHVGDDDDDDKPLAFHPDQQRRTQYQAMAQQQHMMMQAQMQQNMFFGTPSLMGSGFFNPPMAPLPTQMMAVPQMLPQHLSIQPAHDQGKYGRVDRWRHDVAVEGPPAI